MLYRWSSSWGDTMSIEAIIPLVIMGGAFLLIAIVAHTTGQGNLDHIKSKTVGDGQHGTARWATKKEIQQTFKHIPFRPEAWRKGKDLPTDQGLVLGCVGGGPDIGLLWATLFKQRKKAPERPAIQALVDTDDIHCLMIGASGIGKTAFFLYPNLEYACACGMSFLALDTKGDLARNYGTIASRCYGYQVAVIDLRNPTRSDGYNLLTLINHYMDICREDSENLAARAKAEKYAKILSKTIVNPDGDASQYGQNAFFYDAAEGLLTAVVLLLAEYLPPDKKTGTEQRHIVSVFKLVQDLLAPSRTAKGKNGFQVLMNKLPDTHKARWFAGAALNSADQAMMSVMSTVLSRLNAFLDSELEQVLCFDSAINAESFASRKSAIFLILPEEDPSQSLQMIERPLMTPDEPKSIPKGHFIVMKTGTHPMRTRLRLFLEWGITFEEPYVLPEKAARKVAYASKKELEAAIDAYVRDQAAVQAEAAGTAPAPAADDPQNDKNDAEQPKPVDLRTDTEKERDHGVF